MTTSRLEIDWLIGPTCVGKTTYAANAAENLGRAKVLYTGRLCRAALGAEAMARDPNPGAPEAAEDLVREMVRKELEKLSLPCEEPCDESPFCLGCRGLALVDSMPRNAAQARWIVEELAPALRAHAAAHDVRLLLTMRLVWLTCSEDARRKRLQERPEGPSEEALAAIRFNEDIRSVYKVLSYVMSTPLLAGHLPLTVISTEDDEPWPNAMLLEPTLSGR